MNRSFMMDKKASFEEKYGVYNNVKQQQGTTVEFDGTLDMDIEDDIVPPSLEDDPNQASPLPPDIHNASEEDDLDAFIRKAEEQSQQTVDTKEVEIPIIQKQDPTLGAATLNLIEDQLNKLTVKQLKEEYKNKGGTRNVSHNNNKQSLINLILEVVINGSQQEEETEGATTGQDGSVD